MTLGGAQARATAKGQPLWALAGLLLCWIVARALLFELPEGFLPPQLERARSIIGIARSVAGPATTPSEAPNPKVEWGLRPSSLATPLLRASSAPPIASELPFHPPSAAFAPPQHAAAHNVLWMAAMGGIPLLPGIAAATKLPTPVAEMEWGAAALRGRASQWSGDAWLAWRAGPPGLGSAAPAAQVYGASQAGAVLRYHLAPGSSAGSFAYLRAVHALEAREGDLATGLGVRPLAKLPVTVHGEARLARRGSSVTVRPAVFLSGGVDSVPLAQGFSARGYAQAGYVGGRDATGFADGMLVAERPLWRDRESEAGAGAGLWGGAQRGSGRLDLGPTASLRVRVGEGTARLSADYRLRVAGNAEPASGAALTLTAGF